MSLLARFSLANRGLVALIAVVITAFGAFAVPSLKQQLLPSLEFPAAFIVAAYPGAGPEIVERRSPSRSRTASRASPGLDKVTSTSREGSATVQVQYEFGTDLDDVVNKMQTALNRIDAQLPEGVDPQVIAGSTDDLPAVVLAAAGGGDQRALAEKLRARVVPELEGIEGVRTVEVTGTRDAGRGDHPGPGQAGRRAARARPRSAPRCRPTASRCPPARSPTATRALPVQVGTPLATLDDLRGIVLTPTGAGAPVRLGDVATVEQQLAPATSITRTNGKRQPRHRGHRGAGRQRGGDLPRDPRPARRPARPRLRRRADRRLRPGARSSRSRSRA